MTQYVAFTVNGYLNKYTTEKEDDDSLVGWIDSKNNEYYRGGIGMRRAGSSSARPMTPEEIAWLDACIAAGKLVPRPNTFTHKYKVGDLVLWNANTSKLTTEVAAITPDPRTSVSQQGYYIIWDGGYLIPKLGPLKYWWVCESELQLLKTKRRWEGGAHIGKIVTRDTGWHPANGTRPEGILWPEDNKLRTNFLVDDFEPFPYTTSARYMIGLDPWKRQEKPVESDLAMALGMAALTIKDGGKNRVLIETKSTVDSYIQQPLKLKQSNKSKSLKIV